MEKSNFYLEQKIEQTRVFEYVRQSMFRLCHHIIIILKLMKTFLSIYCKKSEILLCIFLFYFSFVFPSKVKYNLSFFHFFPTVYLLLKSQNSYFIPYSVKTKYY